MAHKRITIERDKKVALVAHDNKKRDLVDSPAEISSGEKAAASPDFKTWR